MSKEQLKDETLDQVSGGYDYIEQYLAPGVIQFVKRKVHTLKLAGYNRAQIGQEIYQYIDEMSETNNRYFGNEFGGRIDYLYINMLIDEEMGLL